MNLAYKDYFKKQRNQHFSMMNLAYKDYFKKNPEKQTFFPILLKAAGKLFNRLRSLQYIFICFTGTVRPDWICRRVVSLENPLKGHQPLYVFNFLFLILNI
jgi:hypothetical protein